MALGDYPHTHESPKIHVHSGNQSMSAKTGIFDLVKVTSSDPGHSAVLVVKVAGDSSSHTMALTAGDVLEGPFTSVAVTSTTDGATEVWMYERDSVTKT